MKKKIIEYSSKIHELQAFYNGLDGSKKKEEGIQER